MLRNDKFYKEKKFRRLITNFNKRNKILEDDDKIECNFNGDVLWEGTRKIKRSLRIVPSIFCPLSKIELVTNLSKYLVIKDVLDKKSFCYNYDFNYVGELLNVFKQDVDIEIQNCPDEYLQYCKSYKDDFNPDLYILTLPYIWFKIELIDGKTETYYYARRGKGSLGFDYFDRFWYKYTVKRFKQYSHDKGWSNIKDSINLNTIRGNKLWKKEYEEEMEFDDMIINENKLYDLESLDERENVNWYHEQVEEYDDPICKNGCYGHNKFIF